MGNEECKHAHGQKLANTVPQDTWNWIATVGLTFNSKTTLRNCKNFCRQLKGTTPDVTVYLENRLWLTLVLHGHNTKRGQFL